MKKTLALFLISFSTFAQPTLTKVDSVRLLLQKAFNEKNAADFYELSSDTFRKQLPEAEIKKLILNLHGQLGEWKSSAFEKQTGSIFIYKGIFEKVNQTVRLGLDKQNKLNSLLFQPYAGDKPKKDYVVATNNPMTTALDLQVDSLVRIYIQQKNTAGLAMAIIRDGQVKTYSYGETRLGNHQLPDPDKTLFEIGSISKTFTAVLLANESIKGTIGLEDPIKKYLPDSIPDMAYRGIPITFKTLSNHSSGFPRLPINLYKTGDDLTNPYKNYDEQRMFTYLKNFKPFRAVGENYEYSNFAVGLLGQILASQNHTTYDKLLAKQITEPLKMNHTFISIPASEMSNFAQGYNEKGEATSAWDLNTLAGAGGIRSTVNDLVKYLQANMGDAPENLKKAMQLTHQVTFKKGQNIIGLGWHMTGTIIQHSGGTGGFRSFAGFDPTLKTGVVILSNATEEVAPMAIDLLR